MFALRTLQLSTIALLGFIGFGSVHAAELVLERNDPVLSPDYGSINEVILETGLKVPADLKEFFQCVEVCKKAFPNDNQIPALAACVTQCGKLIPQK